MQSPALNLEFPSSPEGVPAQYDATQYDPGWREAQEEGDTMEIWEEDEEEAQDAHHFVPEMSSTPRAVSSIVYLDVQPATPNPTLQQRFVPTIEDEDEDEGYESSTVGSGSALEQWEDSDQDTEQIRAPAEIPEYIYSESNAGEIPQFQLNAQHSETETTDNTATDTEDDYGTDNAGELQYYDLEHHATDNPDDQL